ncbi:MAG: hypothetical protein GVY35_13240, partial [Bacteroidetes bacterium]|nr:hypothetical protein [Bacteroidota bacterium]
MEAYDTRLFRGHASVQSPFSFAPNRNRFHPVEDLLIPVLGIDAEGTIQHISKAARRLLEYPPDGTI